MKNTDLTAEKGKMRQKQPLVLYGNARIITPLRIIDNGVLMVNDGKIFYIGSEDEIEIPENAKIIDVAGEYLSELNHLKESSGYVIYDLTNASLVTY